MKKLKHLTTRIRQKFQRIPEHSRLPIGLVLALLFTLTLTITSVAIYMVSGANKLDLSRPGFEQEREEVRATEPTKTYNTTDPITRESIDEFLEEYDKRNQDLSEYGDFKGPDLDDTYLQLVDTP